MNKALLVLAVCLPLVAQPRYPKHSFTIGAGAGMPGGDLSGLFRNSGGVSFSYGYRFQRNLQADIGLDMLMGAAKVREFLATDFGYLRIRDFQFLIPFGGRAVLPVREGRLLLSAGGGGAYMRYSERLKQPSYYYTFQCPDCEARSGWGVYALAAGSIALDSNQMFRLGVTAKAYRGRTDGGAVGSVPAIETHDRWVNLFGDFTVSF